MAKAAGKPECAQCKALRKRIGLLVAAKEDLFFESIERGKEMEKIRKLFRAWQGHLPEAFDEALEPVIDGYEKRCTQHTPFEKGKKK